MADDRRIVFGSSVVLQETHVMEEGATKAVMLTQDASGDSIPGKLGSIGNVAITDNQWGEGWTSMGGSEQYWSNMDSHWGDTGDAYSGSMSVGDSAVSLYPTTADVVAQDAVVKFVYVKNVGDNAVRLAIDGSNYDIIIPSKGSVSFRGDGVNLQMNDLIVTQVSLESSIEFILAI